VFFHYSNKLSTACKEFRLDEEIPNAEVDQILASYQKWFVSLPAPVRNEVRQQFGKEGVVRGRLGKWEVVDNSISDA
jgi:hypothetical protein